MVEWIFTNRWMFTTETVNSGSIPSQVKPKTENWYSPLPCLMFNISRALWPLHRVWYGREAVLTQKIARSLVANASWWMKYNLQYYFNITWMLSSICRSLQACFSDEMHEFICRKQCISRIFCRTKLSQHELVVVFSKFVFEGSYRFADRAWTEIIINGKQIRLKKKFFLNMFHLSVLLCSEIYSLPNFVIFLGLWYLNRYRLIILKLFSDTGRHSSG